MDSNVPIIPSEFACDNKNPSLRRSSPPLSWRLNLAETDGSCKVASYVLMLEEIKTGKINWLVKDIPASSLSLGEFLMDSRRW